MLALIAGNGAFPFLFLDELKIKNELAIVICLIGETSKEIEKFGLPCFWVNIGKIDKIISIMRENNVDKAIMCGQVVHTKLFTEVKLDFRAIKLLASLANKKTDSILGAVALELKKEGIELIPSTTYMSSFMPIKKGNLVDFELNNIILDDINFGFETAKKLAGLDIGQTVVVKDKAVVAVEGLEGTDKCIERAYDLAGEGIVVAKVNKPNQDDRFDVPVIGIGTFNMLKTVKASAICFESGKTLFFDIDDCLDIAYKNKIGVYAL